MKKTILYLPILVQTLNLSAQCVQGDCKNGFGRYNYGNGGYYIGYFKDGMEHGQGEVYFVSGAIYKGEFYKSRKHGKGSYYHPSGEINTGDFEEGKFVKGTIQFANGEKYSGEVANGALSGQGTFYWTNGEKYDGEFSNGTFNGYGKKYLLNGSVLSGNWQNGYLRTSNGNSNTSTNPNTQSDYLHYNPNTSISIIGIDNVSIQKLRDAERVIKTYFGFKTAIKPNNLQLEAHYFINGKKKYINADKLVRSFEPDERILFLTDKDIFGSGTELSGYTLLKGKLILSSSEYEMKETIIHEIGHTYGLPHCNNPHCVMNDSSSQTKTDQFCESCKSAIGYE